MTAIGKLAIRNLKEHKSKTIIIALFLVFGVAIVIMGHSFLESVNNDLEKDFRKNYTGDICISIKPKKGELIDLFSYSSPNLTMDIDTMQIPCLYDIDKVWNEISNIEEIDKKTKFISSKVMLSKADEVDINSITEVSKDDLPIALLFSGEEETYWDTFPGLTLIEGTYPKKDSNEVIIDERLKDAFEKTYNTSLNVKDTITVTSPLGTTIREAVVSGIFTPFNKHSAMFQSIYTSSDFARIFANLTYGNINDSNIDMDSIKDFNELTLLSEDELFSDEIEDINTLSHVSFDNILGDVSERDELNKTSDGSWQFVLLKLKNEKDTSKVIAKLNTIFKEKALNARAISWKEAALTYSSSVEGVKMMFNLLVLILAVVVFIIIMNTFTISIMERTSEIGTMRAMGANKKFIKKLYYTETFILTLTSSLIGMALSYVFMAIFNSVDIEVSSTLLKTLLGGSLIHFSPTISITVNTLIIAIIGCLLSNVYPIKASLKITPLKALSKADF